MDSAPWRLTLGLAAACLSFLGCAQSGPRTFELGPHGWLELAIPDGWSAATQVGDSGLMIHRIQPDDGSELLLQVSALAPLERETPAAFAEHFVRFAARELAETAVEGDLPIKELVGPGCRASYVSATDRNVDQPRPGEYRHIDQGAGDLGAFPMTFTLLTNDPVAPERAQALEIIRFARYLPSAQAAAWAQEHALIEPAILAVPGRPWRIELDLPGYALEQVEFSTRRTMVRLFANHPETGVITSAFLEPDANGWTAVQYREWSCGRAIEFCKTNVTRSERGNLALIDYDVLPPPGESGTEWTQRVRHVYLIHDGYWVDVHISKLAFEPADAALFDAISDSIRIRD
jgi:hypothetical protein